MRKSDSLKLSRNGILHSLWSLDLLINLLKLFSIDFINIYVFPISFSIDWKVLGYPALLLLWFINFKRYLAALLLLKSKLSGKYQRFNVIDGSIEMLKNSWISKILIKMKHFKTFCEAQRAIWLNEIIQPHTR